MVGDSSLYIARRRLFSERSREREGELLSLNFKVTATTVLYQRTVSTTNHTDDDDDDR